MVCIKMTRLSKEGQVIRMTVRTLFTQRFRILQSIVADIVGHAIAFVFYFVIILPFGLASRLLSDPLHIKSANMKPSWLDRHAVGSDLDSAKQQG
jgi:membrane-anchored glycerophosphoryl diester phosphodiesterase (GDPDase)